MDDSVPLRNWPSPLYWQATPADAISANTIKSDRSAAVSNPLVFVAVTPCRIADTRNAPSTFGGPTMGGGSIRSFPIPSSPCGIPANAGAYSLNVTVVAPVPLGYLTIWPTGQAQPFVSTLNAPNGGIVANAAIVPAGQQGAISIYVTNTTDVVLDINGYYQPQSTSNSDIYSGVINPDGTIQIGHGFTVNKPGTGLYQIVFPAATFPNVDYSQSPNRAPVKAITPIGTAYLNAMHCSLASDTTYTCNLTFSADTAFEFIVLTSH